MADLNGLLGVGQDRPAKAVRIGVGGGTSSRCIRAWSTAARMESTSVRRGTPAVQPSDSTSCSKISTEGIRPKRSCFGDGMAPFYPMISRRIKRTSTRKHAGRV